MATALSLKRHQIVGYRGTQVLAFVRRTIREKGCAPSYSEIRDELGFLTNSDVRKVIVRLERRALVSRVGRGRVRRIRL
jgi:SOS-response transcriptional repressor LexA